MASISACMIVKNERRNLARTLPNLLQALDEVIVIDTGSSDDTVAFARDCGARVISFEWCADFSAARNFSLQYATSDWILWPDADEWISPFELPMLKTFLDSYSGNALGLPICECPDGTYEPDYTYYRAKIFRNRVGIGFERPFNEQLVCTGRTVFPERNSDIVQVIHWGSLFHLPPDDQQKKIRRNHDILEALIQKYPSDPGYLYSLAMTKIGSEPPEVDATIDLLAQAHSHCPDPQFGQLILYKLGQILFQAGAHAQLDGWLSRILAEDPNFVPFLNLFATREMMQGRYESATTTLQHAIAVMVKQTIAEQVDPHEYGSIPYEKLGLAYLGQSRFSEAKAALNQAITLNPSGNADRFLQLVADKESQCQ